MGHGGAVVDVLARAEIHAAGAAETPSLTAPTGELWTACADIGGLSSGAHAPM